jgi:hypothetical protein
VLAGQQIDRRADRRRLDAAWSLVRYGQSGRAEPRLPATRAQRGAADPPPACCGPRRSRGEEEPGRDSGGTLGCHCPRMPQRQRWRSAFARSPATNCQTARTSSRHPQP